MPFRFFLKQPKTYTCLRRNLEPCFRQKQREKKYLGIAQASCFSISVNQLKIRNNRLTIRKNRVLSTISFQPQIIHGTDVYNEFVIEIGFGGKLDETFGGTGPGTWMLIKTQAWVIFLCEWCCQQNNFAARFQLATRHLY